MKRKVFPRDFDVVVTFPSRPGQLVVLLLREHSQTLFVVLPAYELRRQFRNRRREILPRCASFDRGRREIAAREAN